MLATAEHKYDAARLLEAVAAGEPVAHLQTIRRRKDGEVIDVSLTVSPIKDTAGEVIGASSVARDVSEQRRAERALKDAEERFRHAFDEAPIGMAIISEYGRLEQANTALATICGYTRRDLESMELRALLHPADIQTGTEALRALAAGRQPNRSALDLRIIPAAGSAVDLSFHATRLRHGVTITPGGCSASSSTSPTASDLRHGCSTWPTTTRSPVC